MSEMRMFMVDHSYGCCLVYAGSEREAADMADAVGEVLRVIPFNQPLVFSVARIDGDEEADLQLSIEANCDWEFEDDLEAFLQKHEIALDGDEAKAIDAKRALAGKPPLYPEAQGSDD